MLSASLVKDYARPMGLASNPGLSVGTFINPNATLPGHTPQIDTSRTECSGSGSPGTLDKQAVHQISNGDTPGFISSLFVVPKKDGRNRLVVNLKPLNQFLVYEHFKMEGIHMLKDLLRKGDYLIKIDLKDAYLTVPVWKGHQKHLRFELVEGHSARVCLPSVWASHYSQGFHQTYEACSSHAETKGSAPNYLFRRHADHGRVSQPGTSPCSHSSESTRKSGVCYQLQKLSADFKSANRVFRLSDRFSSFVAPTPRRKVAKNKKTMPKITKFRRGLNTRIIKIPGPPNFFLSGSFPSPSSLSTASEIKDHSLNTLQSYDATIPLDSLAKEELVWWRDHLQAWNGKALFQSSVDLVIETDASRKG